MQKLAPGATETSINVMLLHESHGKLAPGATETPINTRLLKAYHGKLASEAQEPSINTRVLKDSHGKLASESCFEETLSCQMRSLAFTREAKPNLTTNPLEADKTL